jgi:cellulose synthase/poly-beta-1,6-N-acetylglucosamine synthase-like glycosyltransferase
MTVRIENRTAVVHESSSKVVAKQHLSKNVKRYAEWLAKQATYDKANDITQEIMAYRQHATQVVKVGNRKISTFAPFRPELSALQTITKPQTIALCLMILAWGISGLVFGLNMIMVTLAAIAIVYGVNLVLSIFMTFRADQQSAQEQIADDVVHALKDADWPKYTILCPLYREAAVVPQFVQAIQALDYPAEKLQVLFLTEANDHETRNAISALSLPSHFQIVTVPDGSPRTKPRACNYGLLLATGQYIVIYDAEDVPDPLQLKKSVLTFANHETDVVCVQAKLNCYNAQQNILTRWYTAEYSMWFDLILPGLQQLGLAVPLGGTSNHFRTAVLRTLGAWDAYNVTEDCDLGIRLARCHLKTVVLDSTTYEEATSHLRTWLRQRSRWIKGYMQTFLVHMRHPLAMLKNGQFSDLLSLQLVIGNRVGTLFINPLMWILTLIYIAFNSSVVLLYHTLFPKSILYLGAFCFFLGNFFYLYLYLLGCLKQKKYHLIPWALLTPLYWVLTSIAALLALWELLVKPHHWHKTMHGLHLKGKQVIVERTEQAGQLPQDVHGQLHTEALIASEQTSITHTIPASFSGQKSARYTIPVMVARLHAIQQALPLPALSHGQKQAQSRAQRVYVRDLWLIATILTACISSITACSYFFLKHQILLYSDAYSHLRIARAVFDSTNPGLSQLGTVWPPLPHVLMFPFIWNDYLWRTGLTGSFVSMSSYVVTAAYLYLSAHRLTRNRVISYFGTLLFLLNPNILYLQSTPLSELVCICTSTMACYYLLAWIQERRSRLLVFSAACTFLATLARYDGWALFFILLALIVIISLQRRYSWGEIQSNLALFGSLAAFGIVLWITWNVIISGDPLAFQRNGFSAQAQQLVFLKRGMLDTYHNIWMSLKTYTFDAAQTVSPALFVLAIVGLLLFFILRRASPEAFVALAFASIFGFYVLSLYTGQTIIWVPGALPAKANAQFFNVRYGSAMVVPTALSLSILFGNIYELLRYRFSLLIQLALIIAVVAQMWFITTSGVIVIEDGLHGLSCAQIPHGLDKYLAQHYDGGLILEDVTTGDPNLPTIGIDFKKVVYEGSTNLWQQALAHPEKTVEWVIDASKDPTDVLAKQLDLHSPAFLAHFALVFEEPSGLRLYHRKGGPPLSSRPVSNDILADHRTCSRI